MDKTEPANIYALYVSNMKQQQLGRPKRTYRAQIINYLSTPHGEKPSIEQITKWAMNRASWRNMVAVPKKKRPPRAPS